MAVGPQEGWDTELPTQPPPFASTHQPMCKSHYVPSYDFKSFFLGTHTHACPHMHVHIHTDTQGKPNPCEAQTFSGSCGPEGMQEEVGFDGGVRDTSMERHGGKV